jgi:folate-binding protein YgfZ
MTPLFLHEFHQERGARFASLEDVEIAADYGDVLSEYNALIESAAVLDLSFRSRLCLTGADRIKFLHGQVTNDVNALGAGQGCYAALITAKGKMQADLNIYRLPEELLLDFEPGLAEIISQRLEKYIISEDVQVVDVVELYGLLSVQGARARAVMQSLGEFSQLPQKHFGLVSKTDGRGEMYVMNRPRFGGPGYDLFLPAAALPSFAKSLADATRAVGGRLCGWQAGEIARIEAGIPRFGADMDETNIPLEAGLENSAISFKKGCYIGQEVISRIRTYGQVAKALRGLRLTDELKILPGKGDKLYREGKEVGYITSAIASPRLKANIALGYVRRETNQPGTELTLRSDAGETTARIVELPFFESSSSSSSSS